MSEIDPPGIPPVDAAVLSVSFDVDQVGSKLLWSVTDGRKNLLQRCGEYAGSLYFEVSPSTDYFVPVMLTAYGSASFCDFAVEDATIVSIPRNYVSTTTPSPFNSSSGRSACTPVGPFLYLNCDPISGRKRMQAISKRPLSVASSLGAWQLSMIMTVTIHRSHKPYEQTRVFTFDPEAQVGNGSIHHHQQPLCGESGAS